MRKRRQSTSRLRVLRDSHVAQVFPLPILLGLRRVRILVPKKSETRAGRAESRPTGLRRFVARYRRWSVASVLSRWLNDERQPISRDGTSHRALQLGASQ